MKRKRIDGWAEQYLAGSTISQIAIANRVAPTTVRRALTIRGVKIRKKGPIRSDAEECVYADPATARDGLVGSKKLVVALWRYGAKGRGLPGFPPDVCQELLEAAA